MFPIDKAGDKHYYMLRCPVASSIHPNLTPTPDETLSLLREINASRPLSKQLPVELLLHINKELHRPNPLWEDIRTTWKPMAEEYLLDWKHSIELSRFEEEALFYYATLDKETKRFYIPENPSTGHSAWRGIYPIKTLYHEMSSADLLYRLRCYFPEIYIDTSDGYKTVWQTTIQYKQTGLIVVFSEYKAAAQLRAYYDGKNGSSFKADAELRNTLLKEFSIDLLRLLNAFFGTIDGSRQLACYHPTADADYPTSNERYIAVPRKFTGARVMDNASAFNKWHFTKVSTADLSSFRSLVQTLKYDIQSRKTDPVNGTANLTNVISSALLFYRLLCKYVCQEHENVNLTPPITSVWQIQLTHNKTGASIIFMDDHGLFDIRGSENTKEVMSDVEALLESLCSEKCTHPYDGVIAGCIA